MRSRLIMPLLRPVLHSHRMINRRTFASGRPSKATNFLYGTVFLGAASVFGGLMYLLGKDLLGTTSVYTAIDEAVERIEGNPHAVQLLGGLPLSVHGHGGGRGGGRRRPAVRESFTAEGARCLEASFFVEGQQGTGQVSLQTVEDEQGRWRERYLAIQVPGHPLQVLIQPPAEPIQRPSGWRPLQRLAAGTR